MIEKANPVLSKMLERLFGAMVSGPAMNCRPHASRQRLDLTQFARLKDTSPAGILLSLFGEDRSANLVGRVPACLTPARSRTSADTETEEEISPEERAARQAWLDQQSLLSKVRVIADDARTYEQDTGVHALDVGFPLLSLPPGTFGGKAGVASRRILAPIAFIPVTLTMKSGTKPVIQIACQGEGVNLVVPNIALIAWLEQQTGQPLNNAFDDEQGEDPWREISELVRLVARRVDIRWPELFNQPTAPSELALDPTPKADQDEAGAVIVNGAVLGLFPTSNQGLLNDSREMVANGIEEGPIESFLKHGVSLEKTATEAAPLVPVESPTRREFTGERLITIADPCQTRAVRLARQSRGLVIHGPPGTGKSQTIANVIDDHLARGERVLFVCDKRTALDVVADRLNTLGLGDLFATIHDPQRDQRELYRRVREQLDNLSDTTLKAASADKLARVDAELQLLHNELSSYCRELMGAHGGPGSFHHLVGQWLGETGDAGEAVDWKKLQTLQPADFEKHKLRLKETLERGETVSYAANPWKPAVGIDLAGFLSNPMSTHRRTLASSSDAASAADATFDAYHPPFPADADITVEAESRSKIADQLKSLDGLPAEPAQYWTKQEPAAIKSVQDDMAAAQRWIANIKTLPLNPELQRARINVASPDELAREQAELTAYATAFESRAAKLARIQQIAPQVDIATILQWLAADQKLLLAAPKRFEAAAPLADAVDASTLDVSLLARFDAAPMDSAKIFDALAALSSYLEIAGKWTAIFHSAKKKAADPIVKHFGLSLTPATAAQVKQFLADFQKLTDLRAAVETATGHRFDERPDDAHLLSEFRNHRQVVSAMGADAAPNAPAEKTAPPALTETATSTLNQMLGVVSENVRKILAEFGLALTVENARNVGQFLKCLESRLRLVRLVGKLSQLPEPPVDAPAADLLRDVDLIERLLALLAAAPRGTPVGDMVAKALCDKATAPQITTALKRSPVRAAAILKLDQTLIDAGLFSKAYMKAIHDGVRANKPVAKFFVALTTRVDTLEGVIRIKEGLAQLPKDLSAAASTLLGDSCKAATGYSAIKRNVLAGEIVRRLQANPNLQTIDGHRLKTAFDRFRQLSDAKKEIVRDVVQHLWVSRQKERLLAGTGTRLNSLGADLRRRLTTRGERAMRLRQVVAHGAGVEGGDPLFDLRPIWMASPETVAQLFPRKPIFDVVIFDEASQCRLEEALPVLTRAKRVVIAGDPKQLPPTRFFESAVVTSQDMDADTEQELFESQQGDVEDLLTAALGLDVHQCYLDVHYRSRNSDLIGFSNEHFYGSRLQAIPGHPKNRTRYAPITLYRADGIYEKRQNIVEAETVCKIVRDLLKRAAPPSIGIACFNMVQRDLIVEKLEELAENDAELADRLAEARERRGPNSSEGLFVKNLENVQGDERDHLVISTTYGPDAKGKFRRNFGPLGNAGGGRRLNVLVTRARQELHIVTSIPKSAYASLPELPPGTTPSGAWLLFAYLAYAEQLQKDYELNYRILEESGPAQRASVNTRPTRTPSQFAKSLASRLASGQNAGSDVHWGNDGFSIDLAMQHPQRADDVTIGVLCDMTRYAASDDPVEWDVFRTAVHESQGWKIHRVWTPHFFRDPDGSMKDIAASISQTLNQEAPNAS